MKAIMKFRGYCAAGIISVLGLDATVRAQFPPAPDGLTIVRSRINENITISFKEVRMKGNLDMTTGDISKLAINKQALSTKFRNLFTGKGPYLPPHVPSQAFQAPQPDSLEVSPYELTNLHSQDSVRQHQGSARSPDTSICLPERWRIRASSKTTRSTLSSGSSRPATIRKMRRCRYG